MRGLIRTLLATACLLAAALPSQSNPGHDQDLLRMGWLPSDVFDTGEGLPDPTVNAIAVLPNGQVWFGTMRGLARLNGARILPEAGPDGVLGKAILDLATTPEGELLASVEGAGVYRLRSGQWESLGSPFGTARTQRLRTFQANGKTRVFAAGNGIAEWRGKRWVQRRLTASLAGQQNFDVALQPAAPGKPEILWIASFGPGLYRCVGDAECEAVPLDLPGPRTDEVRALALQPGKDGHQVLWVGLQGGGIARLQEGNWTRWHEANSSLPSNFVHELALVPSQDGSQDGQTDVWIGTRSGLAVLRADGSWKQADPRMPLLRERVRTLTVATDSQGSPIIWIGADGGALRTPLAGPWHLTSTLGSRGNGVWDVLVEQAEQGRQRIWLASDGDGLARYEDGAWRSFGKNDGLLNETVRSVARVPRLAGPAELWVGVWGAHLMRLQGEHFAEIPTPWPKRDNGAASILLAEPDAVWVSTRHQGLARWNGKDWQWWKPDGHMPARAYAAVRHGRDIWFSTSDKGLLRYRDGAWQAFDNQLGLPVDALYDLSLIPDANKRPVLWAGSNRNGLLRIDISNPDQPRMVKQPALPELPVPMVYGVARDGVGDLMVCTDYGVFSWRARDKGYTSTAYHRQDGLPHDECNANAMQVDALGRVWIGTIGGLAVYTPSDANGHKSSPLLLSAMLVDGKPLQTGIDKITLPRPDSTLEVQYALLTGEREAASRYRVTLLGDDSRPSYWSTSDAHLFARLPGGTQRVRIEARDHAGTVAVPIELDVEVPRPWWKTPWAMALQLLAALGVLWALLKLREGRQRKQEDQLRGMVRERTAQLQASEAGLQQANEELRRLSYTDPLTGLGNRRMLFESLETQLALAASQRAPIALLLIDLDHFKDFNDTHGHIAGDAWLQDVARQLQLPLPDEALAARYGGEEFCVVLPGHDTASACGIATRLCAGVAGMSATEAPSGKQMTCSIGVASTVPRGPECTDALLARADRALYSAKSLGRNRVECAPD